MSTSTQILFLGVIVAVAAILLGALTELSIGVVAIFLLAGAVYFAFLHSHERGRDRS